MGLYSRFKIYLPITLMASAMVFSSCSQDGGGKDSPNSVSPTTSTETATSTIPANVTVNPLARYDGKYTATLVWSADAPTVEAGTEEKLDVELPIAFEANGGDIKITFTQNPGAVVESQWRVSENGTLVGQANGRLENTVIGVRANEARILDTLVKGSVSVTIQNGSTQQIYTGTLSGSKVGAEPIAASSTKIVTQYDGQYEVFFNDEDQKILKGCLSISKGQGLVAFALGAQEYRATEKIDGDGNLVIKSKASIISFQVEAKVAGSEVTGRYRFANQPFSNLSGSKTTSCVLTQSSTAGTTPSVGGGTGGGTGGTTPSGETGGGTGGTTPSGETGGGTGGTTPAVGGTPGVEMNTCSGGSFMDSVKKPARMRGEKCTFNCQCSLTLRCNAFGRTPNDIIGSIPIISSIQGLVKLGAVAQGASRCESPK